MSSSSVRDSMNGKSSDSIQTQGRFLVLKRNIIDSLLFPSVSTGTMTDKSTIPFNQNCCGKEEKRINLPSVKAKKSLKPIDNMVSKPDEFIIEVPKQSKAPEVSTTEKLPLFYEIISNAWPLSNERVENLMITNKRCQFSNEAISIKPITAGTFILYIYFVSMIDNIL
jgi:hypothetical protein